MLFGGLFNEHKYIGDIAFKRFMQRHSGIADTFHFSKYGTEPPALTIPFKRNGFVREYYQGMYALTDSFSTYTYGDLCGLAADHSVDHTQLLEAIFIQRGARQARGGLFQSFGDDVLKALESHYAGIEEFKNEGDYFSLDYALLGAEDRSHFQEPGLTREQMLRKLTWEVIRVSESFQGHVAKNDPGGLRALFDRTIFDLNNPAKYALLHLLAEEHMNLAGSQDHATQRDARARNFLFGLVLNAFADHFLQDAFASGHLVTQRSANGLDNMGIHDYYNRVGLPVSNETHDTWTTYGDNHYTDIEFERAIEANLVSLEELWETYNAPAEVPLFQRLLADTTGEASWPPLILSEFRAYREMPTPLTREAYTNDIELHHGSKNGMFYRVDYGSTFRDPFNEHIMHAGLGLGYNAIKPKPGSKFAQKPWSHRVESALWVGLGVEYSFANLGDHDIHRAFFVVHTSLKDRLVLDQGLGHAFHPAGGSAGYTALGLELKWLSDRLAPSLKVFADYERQRDPVFGVTVGLRRY